MLIQALCDYYDMLAEQGKVLPEGFSNVNTHFLVSLNSDGSIRNISVHQKQEEVFGAKGKVKIVMRPIVEQMPARSEKPGIDANVIEHRPLYLFGLNYTNDGMQADDRTGKARKSHQAFVKKNLEFLEGLDTPVVNAYREFIKNWVPERETENPALLQLGKSYANAGFVFCLFGHPDKLLHMEETVRNHWVEYKEKTDARETDLSVCGITGEKLPIARVHGKIKGLPGGLATGSVLIGFKNPSMQSYGNEQSYNSNVSERAMKKYTEALNMLLADKRHHTVLDDVTLVYWSISNNKQNDDLMSMLMSGGQDKWDREKMDDVLKNLMKKAREGKVSSDELTLEKLDPDVDFYILGLKPNSSRVSVKFIYHRRFGDILQNIAVHQKDMQLSDKWRYISFYQIKQEMISPKSSNDKIPPALLTRIIQAALYSERNYPKYLLATTIRRMRTDLDIPFESVRIRTGIIKACISRQERNRGNKEELTVGLNEDDLNEGYLCGRLFAVLEQIQQGAAGGKLNRTIKDAYFASASTKPSLVFPTILRLSQNHLKKLAGKGTKQSADAKALEFLVAKIVNQMKTYFPSSLDLDQQGRFMIGYFQQTIKLFPYEKRVSEDYKEEKENDNQ